MKLAIVTPWPYQQTGIADYAYELVSDLSILGHDISVITEVSDPKPLENITFLSVGDFENSYTDYDNIVYHLGNNSFFHIYQIYLLKKTGGTVHLHDLCLHHIMAWILYLNGTPNLYGRILSKWYGPYAGEKAINLLDNNNPIWDDENEILNYPFFEEILQYADSLITHSDFAKNIVTKTFKIPALTIYQLYKPFDNKLESNIIDKKTINIGIFGGVSTNKRVDVVINACKVIVEQGLNIKVDIVGKIEENCKYLIEYINELGLNDVFKFHGRVEEEIFEELFLNMDICVSLRYPSMGETSAIVMRALLNNIPVIVSNVAWYKELPDCIEKVNIDENEVKSLINVISNLCELDRRNCVKNELNIFVKENLFKEKILNSYVNFLKEVK